MNSKEYLRRKKINEMIAEKNLARNKQHEVMRAIIQNPDCIHEFRLLEISNDSAIFYCIKCLQMSCLQYDFNNPETMFEKEWKNI